MTSRRCTGLCCKAFSLPFGYAELLARRDDPSLPDAGEIVGMLLPLLVPPPRPVSTRGNQADDAARWTGAWYTCRNFDWKTGDCGIYETRPTLCRRHGVEDACDYTECEMRPVKGARLEVVR